MCSLTIVALGMELLLADNSGHIVHLRGGEEVAHLTDDISPLEIALTVQKLGAPFITVLVTSAALNLLLKHITTPIRIFSFSFLCVGNRISRKSHLGCEY